MSHPQIQQFKARELVLPHQMRGGLGGIIRCEAYQCREMMNGRSIEIPRTRRVCAEFSNQVTNLGLDHIGNLVDYSQYCQVGEGNAAESVSDTTLDDFVASRVNESYTGWAAQATPPYYGSYQKKYRFLPNFAGGAVNVAEIGIGPQAATGNLFVRALVKDGGGSPTVAPVSATEYFDVFYTLRNYPDHVNYTTGALDDGAGSVTIGGVSYGYTIRCFDITNYVWWGRNIFNGFRAPSLPGGGSTYGYAYGTGAALAAVTATSMTGATPSALGLSSVPIVGGTYADSTYTNTLTYQFGLTDGNVTGGIKGLVISSSLGAYQILFSSQIPKNAGVELNYTQRWTWFRKAL